MNKRVFSQTGANCSDVTTDSPIYYWQQEKNDNNMNMKRNQLASNKQLLNRMMPWVLYMYVDIMCIEIIAYNIHNENIRMC